MLLYGLTFAEDLQPGDVLVTSATYSDLSVVLDVKPNQVKRIDRLPGKSHYGMILVEVQSGEILVLPPSQSVIVGREPTLRDVP